MRLYASLLVLSAALAMSRPATFHVLGEDPGSWPKILSSAGLLPISGGPAGVVVIRRGSETAVQPWLDRVEQGLLLVIEGESAVGGSLGFKPTGKRAVVQSLLDARAPKLSIVWEKPLEVPVYELPAGARVFTSERWDGAPLVAGMRRGKGGVLWVSINPGKEGYERFPYLVQALAELGLEPPFRSGHLWAFFDPSYRLRVDLDYFAKRWREAGIHALQVAAWHYYDSNPESDAYLKRLIEACHKQAILVYAWIELPHVSETFWNQHPEWREKTAILQDAQLDWRKLINLTNRDAFQAVSTGTRDLLMRHDWDGVNLAELYFESLEGEANAARFTPMNADVRSEFRELSGIDPLSLFESGKPRDAAKMREFLTYRANLARRQQTEWLAELEKVRRDKRHLDLVLTHIDDRFDTRMKDLLGADTTATLPLLNQHDFTFLIEDPATIWHLGPQRYPEIATRYQPITPKPGKLAIDINIVERYQDVYPTKLQTGTELFQLIHLAASAFPRVALYFEKSILNQDLPWISSAAAGVTRFESNESHVVVEARNVVGVPWKSPVKVDGSPWPFASDTTVWLPKGAHRVEYGAVTPAVRAVAFSGELQAVTPGPAGFTFSYTASSRAFLKLTRAPRAVELDGQPFAWDTGETVILPKGQHLVTIAN